MEHVDHPTDDQQRGASLQHILLEFRSGDHGFHHDYPRCHDPSYDSAEPFAEANVRSSAQAKGNSRTLREGPAEDLFGDHEGLQREWG